MGLFDNSNNLKSIASRLHDTYYDPFFVSRHDFEERVASDSSYSNLSEVEKSQVFDYYSNHDFYQQLRQEEEAEKASRNTHMMDSLYEQELRIREQAEREKRWEDEAESNVRRISAMSSKRDELMSIFLDFYNFKYKILGAKTKEEMAIVDYFDKTLGTPTFARFYKYKTGCDFKPISYLPGEFIDINDYKSKDGLSVPKEWYMLKDKKHFDPSRKNPGERIEYFEKYGIYFIDGSFLKYLENVEKFKPLISNIETFDSIVENAANGLDSLDNLFASHAAKHHNKVYEALKCIAYNITALECKMYFFRLSFAFLAAYVTGLMMTENVILCSIGALLSIALSYIVFTKVASKNDAKYNATFSHGTLNTAALSRTTPVDVPDIKHYENPFTAFDYAFVTGSLSELENHFTDNVSTYHDLVKSDTTMFFKEMKDNFFAFEKQLINIHDARTKHVRGYFPSYLIAFVVFLLLFAIFV